MTTEMNLIKKKQLEYYRLLDNTILEEYNWLKLLISSWKINT